MRRFALLLLISLLLSTSALASSFSKVYEVKYKHSQTFYMYAGAKATLKLTNLPQPAELIQVNVAHRKDSPKALLLGKRNKHVEAGRFADYNIEIPALGEGRPPKGPIELRIKLFRKLQEGGYEVLETYSNYIRLMACPKYREEVCAFMKASCRGRRCSEGEKLVTFANQCEMKKHGGELAYIGSCSY